MISGRAASLRISTPDGVRFTLPLAGPIPRALAFILDLLIISVSSGIVMMFLGSMGLLSEDLLSGAGMLLGFALYILYSMMFEALWGGRTPGKRILGLRVADDRGLRLRPSQVIVRNVLRAVDSLPFFYLVGGLVSFFNRRCQRLGDLAAGTVVLQESPPPPTDGNFIEPGRFNSLADHPALEARLRQRTAPAETLALVAALARRESLNADDRVGLYADFAAHFLEKVKIPADLMDGLTDEQLLRNLADSLTRRASPGPSGR